MASDLCLSKNEVAALCRTPQRARQRKFLQLNGIRHYLDAHGWPVVLRASVAELPAIPASAGGWKSNKAA